MRRSLSTAVAVSVLVAAPLGLIVLARPLRLRASRARARLWSPAAAPGHHRGHRTFAPSGARHAPG
jgi:hypothetical protein